MSDAAPPHIVETGTHTVWVHDGRTGAVLGRFGRFGIDVHFAIDPDTLQHIDKEGRIQHTQCAACRHDLRGREAWDYFKKAMLDRHGVEVTNMDKPEWLE